MAEFSLVDVATRAIHSCIQKLQLKMVRVVLSQNDISQLEQLLTVIPVSRESFFSGQLTHVIVEQTRRARDGNKFVNVAEH